MNIAKLLSITIYLSIFFVRGDRSTASSASICYPQLAQCAFGHLQPSKGAGSAITRTGIPAC